ncbi:MAG: penicillin-binding protein 2 [Treponemataceae bacterium]|nr:MAG: penicillin-binding protein 2 [Treponemataceae bacterium]
MNGTNREVSFFFLSVFVLILLYIFRLFSMQIIHGESYRASSVKLANRVKEIPAQRGEIYDRNYTSDTSGAVQPIAANGTAFAVDLMPGNIPAGRYDAVSARLAGYLKIRKQEIDAKVPPNMRKSFTAIEIKSNIPFVQIQDIAENIIDLPGVSWRIKYTRNYRKTGSFSHVVGYTGDITKDELRVLINHGYTQTSVIGKTGIEKQYDAILQGKNGTESHTVDVQGRVVTKAPIIQTPEMGKNLVLTIDNRVQELAEKALGERVGAAIVLKPSTGEILAMVSYPNFDANIFNSDNSSAAYSQLVNAPNKPLLNRAINAQYPPASTFKVVMSTALLEEKTFSKDLRVQCEGTISYGNRIFHCHIFPRGHGWLDLKNGLAQSCNVYFWTIGSEHLGVDRISTYARKFGMGSSLGIDLPNGSEGFIPDATWKERKYHEKWLGGDTMSMSIGQGYTLVTPLHIANMMAMVSNSGKIYKPHILKEIRTPVTGELVSRTERELLHEANVSEETWAFLQEDLRYTITSGSAAYPLTNRIVQIAGKTGTAEVTGYDKQWHSWFVAYAPFDAPPEERIVVCVLVEAVNKWEWWAPYASNIIFQGYFANQTFDEAIDALGFRYLASPVGRQE